MSGDNHSKAKANLENAIQAKIDHIELNYLRKLMGKMYTCSANCCEQKSSIDQVNLCLEKCAAPWKLAQQFVAKELNNYQERLSRCVSVCNDKAQDELGGRPTDAQVEKASAAFEACADNCIRSHIDLLPGFSRKMEDYLADLLKTSH